MGDDFIVTQKDRYNRSLTKNLRAHYQQPSLFRPRIKESVSYPCQLNEATEIPSVGHRLTLRVVQDSVQILDDYRVLGCVSAEASRDAIDDFKDNPEFKGIVMVNVTSVFAETRRIDVTPNCASGNGEK
jgi:hypothetical protein